MTVELKHSGIFNSKEGIISSKFYPFRVVFVSGMLAVNCHTIVKVLISSRIMIDVIAQKM